MSTTIVFKYSDCPEKVWRKGFQCAASFKGVDHSCCGVVANMFAVKGQNIDQDKLLKKLKKILKSAEIIDHSEYPEDHFFLPIS